MIGHADQRIQGPLQTAEVFQNLGIAPVLCTDELAPDHPALVNNIGLRRAGSVPKVARVRRVVEVSTADLVWTR